MISGRCPAQRTEAEGFWFPVLEKNNKTRHSETELENGWVDRAEILHEHRPIHGIYEINIKKIIVK